MLIFNFSIFNFQFLILRSFRTSWDDKLKWLCKLIIFPLCASIFNFLWIATSCKQLSQWQVKNNRDCYGFFKASQWQFFFSSLRAKRSNPQTTNVLFIHRKIKEFAINKKHKIKIKRIHYSLPSSSLRGVKRRSNPQTIKSQYKNRK